MSDELKPCPYCGGADIQIENRVAELSYAVCNCCGAFGPSGLGTDGAIAAWNERVPSEHFVDSNKSSDNPPLTPEELREMGGEPVYMVYGDDYDVLHLSSNVADYIFEVTNCGAVAYRRKPKEG